MQAKVAAQDLASAIRAFAVIHAMPEFEEIASTYEQLLIGHPLEGDYDVLVAQKLHSLADLFRSGGVWDLKTLQSRQRELLAELREAIGAPNP